MIISKSELESIVNARCATAHNFLGMQKCDGGVVVRAYMNDAKKIELIDKRKKDTPAIPFEMLDESGFFELFLKSVRKPFKYRLRIEDYRGGIR